MSTGHVLLHDYIGCVLRLSEASAPVLHYMSFPSGDPSEVTTVLLLLPECQRSRPPSSSCGSLSFSDSAGRWKMVSINSSEQHGWLCREESWGRGNGSVQEERGAWLWLPAATISPHRRSWCCRALMDWLTDWLPVQPGRSTAKKRFLQGIFSGNFSERPPPPPPRLGPPRHSEVHGLLN